jgi:hypothetical protein
MAQRLSTSFVNTNIPGAYPEVTVKSTPVGITSTGDIVIIGEAEGGADYTQETLKDNFFTPTQLDRVSAKYLRGPIVDAMRALVSPSNDTEITGSVGKVYVVKTNSGTKAKSELQVYPSSVSGYFFEDDVTVYADAAPPKKDPQGDEGWYYKNDGDGGFNKINWYFYADSDAIAVTVGDLSSLYAVAEVRSDSTDNFHLAYYTIKQNDGNDAGSWYRSRQVYTPIEPFDRNKKHLFYVGTEPDANIHPELDRVECQLSLISSVGPNDPSEEILTTVIGTNSAAIVDSVEILVQKLGIIASNYQDEKTLLVRESYGLLESSNYGVDGNKYYYQVTQVENEVGPFKESSSLSFSDPSIYDGLTFAIRENGKAAQTIQLGIGGHSNISEIASEINSLLPTGLKCEANLDLNSLIISSKIDLLANKKGFGKSFELIDAVAGDLSVIGFSEELVVSSQEPEIELSVKRQDTNTNESFAVEAEVAITVGYDGTSATLDISSGVLSTTVVGGSGSNLSINLSEYTTMSDLASFISSQTGYSASSIAASNNLSPLRLDEVSAVGIASSEGSEPGRVKKAAYNFALKLSESSVVDFEFAVGAGLPAETAQAKYLAGGTKGATTAADIVNAIPALEGIKVNFVLPLFSRDAADDIADGLTDSSSTYTIDAVNFAVKSHVLAMSTVKLKRNRIAMLSKDASYADVKAHSQSLSSFRSIVCFQKTSQVDALGNVVEFQPWHTAAIATGMQSAGFYKSLTNKFANVISFKDPAGFDSGNPGSVEDAIDAGLMFLQAETAGNKFVVDQTTYGFDTNFVYNSLQAVYMSDVLAIQLAESLERFAVGKSLADITAASMAGHISKVMEVYKRLKITGASDDAPLGFKNLKININGPIAEVKLEAKLATAILFIPIQLELSQIQSSASA